MRARPGIPSLAPPSRVRTGAGATRTRWPSSSIRMSRAKRLTLLAAILGSAVATIDGSIVNVALPAIEEDLGGGLGAAVGVERVPAGARLADPDRRLARRHLRRAARVRARRRRLRRPVDRVRGRADDRGADRRPRAAGRGRRAGHAELARDHRRRLRAERARRGDRLLDGLGRDRGDRRAARRRPDRRPGLVALDLRAQRAVRPRDARADPRGRAASDARGGRDGRLPRRGLCARSGSVGSCSR